MKNILKQNKGVTVVSLAVVIVILVIVTNILLYNAKDSTYIKKLTSMQNDVSKLREKVSSYYSIYGEIPANVKYENEDAINKIKDSGAIGKNDDIDQFYVIELSALEGLTLNFGKDYSIVEELSPITEDEQEEINELYDIYIINKSSHNIFYVEGIDVKNDKKYYTDDKNIDGEKIDLRYVEGVKIPDGFYYCGGTKDEGIVISDEPDDDLSNSRQGNQFVWVPVENFDEFVREDFSTKNIADTEFINTEPTLEKYYEPEGNGQDEGTEIQDMYKSVKEYKGFYIARYEAGTTDTTSGATGIRGKVVSKKGANVYSNISYGESFENESGGAVEASRNMAVDNNYTSVKSTLCYGVQWDAVMRWISKDESLSEYLTDSTGKGNYSDSTNNLAKSGAVEDYQMKNIFDMAGNVWEWTMESHSTDRKIYRGGSYNSEGSSHPVTSRNYNSFSPDYYNSSLGFRPTLYLIPEEDQWSATYDQEAIYTDENGEQAYIPKGFQVSTSPYCNKIANGLVVREASTQDEYVWIDVPKSIYTDTTYIASNNNTEVTSETDYNGIYNILNAYCYSYREGKQGQERYWVDEYYEGCGIQASGDKTAAEVYTEMYQTMLSSVYKNGGFYISRYEAGIAGTTGPIVDGDTSITSLVRDDASDRITSASPKAISQKDAIPYNYVYCSEAQSLASNMAQDSGKKSSLMFGIQWDLVCKFLEVRSSLNEQDIKTDSTDWGNYANKELIIYSINAKSLDESKWNEIKVKTKKFADRRSILSTGASNTTQKMNIYDFAGNMKEWTLEHATERDCSARSGCFTNFGDYRPAAVRMNAQITQTGYDYAFRVTFY